MATNFSINARRIRDLQEVTAIGSQFVPSASYVLVDAADDSSKYTSYKMKITTLSSAISGMVADSTISDIRSQLNGASAEIKTTVADAVSSDILTDEFKNTIKTDVANKLITDGISSSVTTALLENGLLAAITQNLRDDGIINDVLLELESDGITLSVAAELSSDSAFKNDIFDSLITNNSFITRITERFSVDDIANAISSSPNFTTDIVQPVAASVSAVLTADNDFINTLKSLVQA